MLDKQTRWWGNGPKNVLYQNNCWLRPENDVSVVLYTLHSLYASFKACLMMFMLSDGMRLVRSRVMCNQEAICISMLNVLLLPMAIYHAIFFCSWCCSSCEYQAIGALRDMRIKIHAGFGFLNYQNSTKSFLHIYYYDFGWWSNSSLCVCVFSAHCWLHLPIFKVNLFT